jgi:hypothetical protein
MQIRSENERLKITDCHLAVLFRYRETLQRGISKLAFVIIYNIQYITVINSLRILKLDGNAAYTEQKFLIL